MWNRTLIFAVAALFACESSSDPGGGAGAAGAAGATGGNAGAGVAGHGNADAGLAGAGSGGSAGGGGANACTTLESEYANAIASAKTCSVDSATSCDEALDTSIAGCGYYVFGDAENTEALNQMAELEAEWAALQCVPSGTCAVGGFPPMTATCQPTGQGGSMGICTPGP